MYLSGRSNRRRALKDIFQFALILVFLSVFFGASPVENIAARGVEPAPLPETISSAPLLAPLASVTLAVPATLQIGEAFSFTATFDNTDADEVGYGPFIDVYFPVIGVDGAGAAVDDGIDFVSASFLGGSITTVSQTFPAAPLGGPCGAAQSPVNHPYAVDATGAFVIVCGTPGDKVVTFLLPFGSFTPGQTPAVVTVQATLSNFADEGTALSLLARGGYQYGSTPLNDWCCGDPSIVSHAPDTGTWPASSVTPTLLSMTKTYNGPENETATGPNYLRQYTLAVDIAPGQTVTSLIVTDTFPNNMQFVSVASTTPAAICTTVPTPLITPGGTLTCDFGSVTGGAGTDATVVINFYIPLNDSGGAPVINAADGDDETSDNTSGVSGSWDPLDSRDTITAVTASAVCPTDCPSLNDRSIAIQKSVAIVTDVGVTGTSPGDTLQYTLVFQISDFFSFQGVVLTDVLSDGQRVDLTFTPTLQVNGNGFTSASAGMAAANYSIDNTQIGNSGPNPPADGTDGTQTIILRASDELITRGETGKLVGGCIPVAGTGGPVPSCLSYDNGATTGTIIFRAIIQDQFTDTYPSGDPSVDHGDVLANDVTIIGNLLSVVDNSTPTGSSEQDTSSAGSTIAFGTLAKSVYAINDTVCPDAVVCPGAGPYEIKPGDEVTYRIQYGQPSSDFEQTVLTDYLPLPVFKAEDPEADGGAATVWSQDLTAATTPPAGEWKYGPADSTHLRPGAPTPTTATDATDNTLAFTYAAYDDPTNTSSAIDLLFTVTATSEPFTDQLFLTNQLTVDEGTTNAGSQTLNAIVQVILTQPVLTTKKGIVESSDDPANGGDAVYTPALPVSPDFTEPGTAGLRFTPPILSSSGAGNSNISNVDAGDLVTFVIFVENSGSSVNGAFDIRIRDTLMPGYVIPGGAPGLNLDVRRGDGSAVGFTNIGTGLFDAAGGIEITDPGLGVGACEHGAVGNGRNVIVITYDLQVDVSFTGGTIINTGTLFNYAGSEGGSDHTTPDLSDTASTTIIGAPVKSIISTSEVDTVETGVGTTADPRLAAVGEIVRYRISVQIPEGTTNNFRMRDNIPDGMSFLDDSDTVSVAFVSNQGTCGQNISSSTLGTSPGLCGSTVLTPTFFLNFGSVSNDTAVSSFDSTDPLSYLADDGDTYINGTDVYFKLGNITNDDRDFDSEYIVIEFNVLMRNEAVNVSGANLNNTSIYRTGTSTSNSTASNTTRARVAEPLITFGKIIVSTPTPLDAGGQVTYRITVANGTGANVSTAFDLVVVDILPNALTLDALPGSVVVTPLTGMVGAVDTSNSAVNSPPGTPSRMDVRIVSLAPNSSVQIDYTATINSSITPGQIVTNTGNATWTSLPGTNGTTGNGTLSNTPGNSGDADGERNGSGGVNNYNATDSESLTADSSAPVKSIVSTSAIHTSETGDGSAGNPRDLAIGETIRYRLAVQILEGTTSDLQLVDTLPAGFTFLNDGNVLLSFIADNNVTEEADLAGADNDALPATFVLPASRIAVAGQVVTFTVGDLVNNDSDAGQEFVVIDFNVLVNNDANNNNTDLDNNDFDLVVSGVTVATSNTVGTRIVEPVLNITKSVTDPAPAVGQVVSFTITLSHDVTSTADAFNVVIMDDLPTQLALASPITVSTSGPVVNAASTVSAGDVVQVTVDSIGLIGAGTITITFDATVVSATPPGFQNDAISTWTSLPGTVAGERTGVDGVGGLNDHTDTASVVFNANRALAKNLIATNVTSTTTPDVTIGEIVTYEIVLTIPPSADGATDSAIVTDTLDSGLAFVDCSQMTAGQNISTTTPTIDFTDVNNCNHGTNVLTNNPVISNSGGTIRFDLGNIGNSAGTAQTITLTYRAIVLDSAANVQNQGVLLDNDVDWTWATGTKSVTVSPALEIVEPDMQIEKTVNPAIAALGSIVTFTIDIGHTPLSQTTAYDVILTDNIPAGLVLVPGSVTVTETGGVTAGDDSTSTPTSVVVSWDIFPLNGTARVTFQATYTGPDAVFNTASVEWSTLEIDPILGVSVQQSTYNVLSTERRYDPLDATGVNNYIVSSSVRLSIPQRLPRTGFAPGVVTNLPEQPNDFAYAALGDLWLEIPDLGVRVDIVGVPYEADDWNLTWLAANAGYLDGTAYPTHAGNTGITAHAYLADGTPGPFVKLDTLGYGDQVIVHMGAQQYIYEVREEKLLRPDSVSSALKHEEYPWLTLITCKAYSEYTKEYVYRTVVRAILVDVIPE